MAGDVEEVKQKTDIVSLIGEYVDLKKAGRNYKALCPFHSEKTPSFMVSPELQIFKCFGCSEVGDAIAFLQKYEGMDFPEALKFLADRAGIKLKPSKFGDREGKEKLLEINALATKFYQYVLLKHSAGRPALFYLTRKRGLKESTIKTFQLGYSPDTPGALKKFLIDKKGFSRRDIERTGLVYAKGGGFFDRFRGRIIFPLHDHRGNIAGFAGRILPRKKFSDLAKYINTPETAVYHKSKLLYGLNATRGDIKKTNQAVVVEGELDVISSWQAGIKNVVAIKGSALTEDQGRLLRRFAQRVVLALDADLAGDTAARRGIEVAESAGLEVKVARLGEFKDPDEMAKKNPKKLKKVVKDAVGVWDFVVESVFSRYDTKTGPGKAKISGEIIPLLASIGDRIVQAHYCEIVAKRLGVPTAAVVEQIETAKAQNKTQKRGIERLVKPETKSRRQLLEERLLALAFSSDPKILLDKEVSLLIKTPLAKRIAENYRDYSKDANDFNPSEFAEGLPNELTDGFSDMILKDLPGSTNKVPASQKEIPLVKCELQILEIKNQLEKAAGQIRKFEEEKQGRKLKAVEKQFGKLARDLRKLEESEHRGIIL